MWFLVKNKCDATWPCSLQHQVFQTLPICTVIPLWQIGTTICTFRGRVNLNVVHTSTALESVKKRKKTLLYGLSKTHFREGSHSAWNEVSIFILKKLLRYTFVHSCYYGDNLLIMSITKSVLIQTEQVFQFPNWKVSFYIFLFVYHAAA